MALSVKQKAFLIAYKENNFNISKACLEVGIDRKSHYNWIEKNLQYSTKFKEIEEEISDKYEQLLLEQSEAGNVQATIFYLKTKGRKRGYSEKVEVEHSGKISGITLEIVKNES